MTALWLNPVFPSNSHHNYFTTDFFDTDPEYGTPADFAALCRVVHDRGMRILLDMETQYVPREHPWFQDAVENPASAYTNRFLFQGKDNTDPVHLSLQMTHGGESGRIDLPGGRPAFPDQREAAARDPLATRRAACPRTPRRLHRGAGLNMSRPGR